jgi:hypothetical protein
VAVDSQTNTQTVEDLQAAGHLQPEHKTLKTYPITLAVRSEAGSQPSIRVIQIKADSESTVETLAFGLITFLGAATIQSISSEYASGLIASRAILKIGPAMRSDKCKGRAWTRREILELLLTHGSANNAYGY